MGFKIKRKKSIFGISAVKEKMKQMSRIAKMLDDGDYDEALPLLQGAVKKYPNDEPLWEMLAFVGNELNLNRTMQKAFAKLVQFQPNDPDNWHNLAATYIFDTYPALAMQTFREFARRFPFDSRSETALEVAEVAEKDIKGLFEVYDLLDNADLTKIAVLHDKVQLFMHHEEYEKAIETAIELIKKVPDFISPYNNLSLVYFMIGKIEKALETAKLALEKQPDNYHALGNTARYLAFLGRNDEAQNFGNRLRLTEGESSDICDKKIETFAYLGDDEAIVEVYQEVEEKKIKLQNKGFSKNLAAFSFYQLGDEKKAKKLWEEAVEDDCDEAGNNLEQIKLPVFERNIYAFGLRYWLPKIYMNEWLNLIKDVKEDDNFEFNMDQKNNQFFNKYPYIINVFQIVLERGDIKSKEFVIRIIKRLNNPKASEILKEFALGKIGSDSIRHQAAMVLKELKFIPNKVQLWMKGEQSEFNLKGFFITGEVLINKNYPMKPKVGDLIANGFEARQKGNLELADQYFKKAQKIQPDHPVLLNNLLVTRQAKGEKFDIEKEVRDMHTRFPDYFFGAVNLALFVVSKGNVEEAKRIVERFEDKETWHISEFNLYSKLQIEICLAEKLFDGAKSWHSQMVQANERFDLTEAEIAEFKELEIKIQTEELYDKLSSGVKKLFGRGKKKKK